jgi:hypothetical protein
MKERIIVWAEAELRYVLEVLEAKSMERLK